MNISIILTLGRQAQLAYRTLQSVERAAAAARDAGLKCEIVVVLDRADDVTRGYIERFPGHIAHKIELACGNLSVARHAGAAEAKGKYVACINGQDIMSGDWLVKAHAAAEKARHPRLILHPLVGVVFDAENHCLQFGWSAGPAFSPLQLTASHPWTANLFCERRLLCEPPPTISDEAVWAEQPTHFVCEQMARGGVLRTVDETCVFLRRQSYVGAGRQAATLLPPTQALNPLVHSAPRPATLAPATISLVTDEARQLPPTKPTLTTSPRSKPSGAQRFSEQLRQLPSKVEREWQRFYNRRLKRRHPSLPKHPTSKASFTAKNAAKLRKVLGKIEREWQRFRIRRLGACAPTVVTSPAPSIEIPAWLWNACRDAHGVEPKIFPVEHVLQDRRWGRDSASVATAYQQLCGECQTPFTHVVLLPWLKTGGVDLEALNYVQAIVAESSLNRVLVVATENSESTWAHRLPPDVAFVPFGRYACELPPAEQARLLATWLVQLQPRVIHNMNSHLAYVVLRDYGPALKQVSRLYASVFCEDITAEGRTVGWAFDRLPECCEHLDGVFADNLRILQVLQQTFGLPADRMHLHYQPMELATPIAQRRTGPLQVLWAGRLDRQKRLDLLAKIAERLQGAPIHFTVYGSTVLQYDRLDLHWQKFANITYRGPFDGFHTLPLSEFDVLLHTAQWEGLPNVLLESLASGLPVVASAVGGVPELIDNGVTGVCVRPFDDVEGYCSALRRLAGDAAELQRLARQGRQQVAQRHSWSAFRSSLQQLPAYLTPCEQAAEQADSRRAA